MEKICSVDLCDRVQKTKGLCSGHYSRLFNFGDVRADVPLKNVSPPETCSIEGCDRKYKAKGYCAIHWHRWKKFGDPGTAEVRESGKNLHTDYAGRIWSITGVKASGYVHAYLWGSNNSQSTVAYHRIVMQDHLGRELLPHETIHHINGVKDDNRLENLELWSSWQPPGQRITDKVAWAREILALYGGKEN